MIPLPRVEQQPDYRQSSLAVTENKRIYLFSSCELRRIGLYSICSKNSGFTVVGTENELSENLENVLTSKPDVIIIDITLFSSKHSENLGEIFQPLLNICQVAILADKLDVSFACSAVINGANGYLLTSVSIDEFLQALCVVTAGGIWLGQTLTHKLIRQSNPVSPVPASSPPRLLSQREQQILNYIARGKTSKEIAAELYLSESSIRTYWHRILNKLNALNKADAVARAGYLGLLNYTIEDDEEAFNVISPRLKELLDERLQHAAHN